MALYVGNVKVVPSVVYQTVLTATNNTGSAINQNDKVWINSNGGGYVLDNFLTTTSENVERHGSISITDGVVSGFSMTAYLTLQNPPASITSAEMVFKFKTGSNVYSFQNIFACQFTECYISGGTLNVWSETVGTNASCGSVSTNTTYWVKVVVANGQTKISYSTDGETYTGEASITNDRTTTNYFNIGFGVPAAGTSRYFRGTIDLNDSYINVDGSLFWEYELTTATITTSTLTGKAQENIAAGASGKVILG